MTEVYDDILSHGLQSWRDAVQATLPQLRISAPRSWSASESSDPDEASDSKETSETDCPACESRMDNDHDAGSQTNHSWTREPYWNRSGLAPDDAEPDDEDESPPCQAYEEFCSQFPHAEYHAEDFANGHFDKDLNIWVLKQ